VGGGVYPVYPVLDGALSDTASTGLILGGGAVGCGLLVLGLTVLALRRGARAEALERERRQRVRATAHTRSKRASAAAAAAAATKGTAVGELGAHDPYPPQPYSSHEPGSHQPYSRPYRVPKQEPHAATNGHRPAGTNATGIPGAPYTPPDDEE
jgi:hypothetical protein